MSPALPVEIFDLIAQRLADEATAASRSALFNLLLASDQVYAIATKHLYRTLELSGTGSVFAGLQYPPANRHNDRRHPFLRFLQLACAPKHVCWKFPTFTERKAWKMVGARSRTLRGRKRSSALPSLLPQCTAAAVGMVGSTMEDVWQPDVLCVHAAVSERLPTPSEGKTRTRIFFDHCACYYDDVKACFNGIKPDVRGKLLQQHVFEMDPLGRLVPRRGMWEFVDAGAVSEPDDEVGAVQAAFWGHVDEDARIDLERRIR
ncbi:hypothetical protein Q5752_001710 [Cryptotrichosporon argae]